MAEKKKKKSKPREEYNIGPATPIGRGNQPLDPDAHRIARNLAVGATFGMASPLYKAFAVSAGAGATLAVAKHGKRFGLKKTPDFDPGEEPPTSKEGTNNVDFNPALLRNQESRINALTKEAAKLTNRLKKSKKKQTSKQKPLPVSVRSRKTGIEDIRKTVEMRSSNRLAGIKYSDLESADLALHHKRSGASGNIARAFRAGAKAQIIKASRRKK